MIPRCISQGIATFEAAAHATGEAIILPENAEVFVLNDLECPWVCLYSQVTPDSTAAIVVTVDPALLQPSQHFALVLNR
jgi:hypothetical protein